MVKKSNKKILSFFVLSFLLISVLLSTSIYAVPEESETIIDRLSITDGKGDPLEEGVSSHTTFMIKGEFSLPNNTFTEGDTTKIILGDHLTFPSSAPFDIKDKNGEIVARAKVDIATKTLLLTYTDFVDSHSDIAGEFYISVRVDTVTTQEPGKLEVKIDVDGEVIVAGEIDYTGIVEIGESDFDKGGWLDEQDPQAAWYHLVVNRSHSEFKNAVLTDNLQTEGLRIDVSSFQVYKGTWKNIDGE